MRRIYSLSMLLLISGVALGIAFASVAGLAAPHPTGQQEATRIESDQKTGAIRFIVNGKEVARFDAKGLHVKDDIDYGGALIDR